ncbi:MAG: TIGR01244 family phosphatase [Porticoccaceae bacterium]|nr:TIGR01244 family phosphatase [Porticoccaceae bacterium]
METHQLTKALHVTSQITLEDVQTAAEQGFTTIINNRPDGEEADQLTASEMEAVAQQMGIRYIHQPVVGGNISADDVATFSRLIGEQPGKVLAHCRTGTRCTMLWALSQAGKQSADSLLATAKKAGYDLEQLRDRLN